MKYTSLEGTIQSTKQQEPTMPISIEQLPEDELTDILKKHFTSDFRQGYVLAGGTTMPAYFADFAEKIRGMEVREDDVFVCSFPKCGTTWMQELVWCVANDLDYEKAKIPLPERFPFLEHTALFDYRDIMQNRAEIRFPPFVLDSVGYVSALRGPRFIKTHLPLSLLPSALRQENRTAKIIYVSRDPRDCCVSYYHHCRLLEGYSGDLRDFIRLFLAGRLCFAPFWQHVMDFWKIRHEKNILFISYEDMKKDLGEVINKVSKFLNKSYTEDEIESLKEHLSFDSMKNNGSVNYESVAATNRKYGLITEAGSFMRTGRSGQFREVMTAEDVDVFRMWSEICVTETDFNIKF